MPVLALITEGEMGACVPGEIGAIGDTACMLGEIGALGYAPASGEGVPTCMLGEIGALGYAAAGGEMGATWGPAM